MCLSMACNSFKAHYAHKIKLLFEAKILSNFCQDCGVLDQGHLGEPPESVAPPIDFNRNATNAKIWYSM